LFGDRRSAKGRLSRHPEGPALIALIFAAVVAAPAPAADAASVQTAPAATAAPPVKPKLVCSSVIPTGSVMPKRVCLTSEQWAARSKSDLRDRDRLQSQLGPVRDLRSN
jgi:hypothetical protein